MSTQIIVNGTLKPDGTLELDQKPAFSAGRVRVIIEKPAPATNPARFWSMMQSIWSDLQGSGHVPRTREQIDAEIRALRDDDEERLQAVEKLHEECKRSRKQAPQPKDLPS